MLGIKWIDEPTNESIRLQVANMAGSTQRGILEIAKERKMRLVGHVTRHPEYLELAHTIMHGHVPRNRARGRPQRKWTDDIVRWTGLRVVEAVRASSSRCRWRDISHQSASTDRHGLWRRRRRRRRNAETALCSILVLLCAIMFLGIARWNSAAVSNCLRILFNVQRDDEF